MKKVFLLCSMLLMIISCSRTNSSTEETKEFHSSSSSSDSSSEYTKTSARIQVLDPIGNPKSGITVLFVKRKEPDNPQSEVDILEKAETNSKGIAQFDLTKYEAYEGEVFHFIAGRYINGKFSFPTNSIQPFIKIRKGVISSSAIVIPKNF